jgi:hypothetical protein
VTKHNDAGHSFCNRNEDVLKRRPRNHWRASLVPAAAVIPAPIAYIEVVAVKKFVVGRKRVDRCGGTALGPAVDLHMSGVTHSTEPFHL